MDESEEDGVGPHPNGMPSPGQMMSMVQDLKARSEAYCEYLSEVAKMMKAAFDALIKNGFTEAQAMQIVCARGWQM